MLRWWTRHLDQRTHRRLRGHTGRDMTGAVQAGRHQKTDQRNQ